MDKDLDMDKTRRLAGALEPFAGQVYFSPECHAAYQSLGFADSTTVVGGVAMPDGPAYFCSRGSLLGQVPGEVVAATFGVFNPAVVIPAVEEGWKRTSAEEIGTARTEGSLAQLVRLLGESPEGCEVLASILGPVSESLEPAGHPLYAGLLAQPVPDQPLGAAWRYADRLREFRGDAHIGAWTSMGFDAVEIGLLTELYWGLPSKSYIRTRAWSEAEMDAGIDRLRSRGLVDAAQLTDRGRDEREQVEIQTDRQCLALISALGDRFEEAVAILSRFSHTIQAGHGYPAAGPHDLAGA